MIDVRAWLASASWACLCGIAASLFLTVSLVGLFVLFFGALSRPCSRRCSCCCPRTGSGPAGSGSAIGLALWLAVVALLGAIARWAYLRCRAVVFVGAARWPRATSIIVGALAALVLVGTVPGQGLRFLPQATPVPEPSRDPPLTV